MLDHTTAAELTVAPRRPRFGIQVVAESTTWPAFVEAIQAVEALGYDSLWNHDHLLPVFAPPQEPVFETITTLTAMAMLTTRIRLGTLVNGVLYRHPAILAKQAAVIDILSNGRLELSMGSAWAAHEFAAYGLPFPPPAERLARTDEALQLIRSLWTTDLTTFTGRYYQLTDAGSAPKPLQQPHPPIMIGGGGPKTLRLVAKHANIWNGEVGPQECRQKIEVIRQHCAEIDRDPAEIEMSVHPAMAIGRTNAEAESVAEALAARRRESLDEHRAKWLLGTPAQIIEQLHAYLEAGITHWTMPLIAPYDLRQIELFAEQVIPEFR